MVVAFGAATPAIAQSTVAQSRMFLEASIRADHDTTLGLNPVGTTKAAGFGAGVVLTDHYSVRFEVDVPSWHVNDSYFYYSATQSSFTSHEEERTLSYSLMVARHLKPSGPLRIAFLAGISKTDRQIQGSFSDDHFTPTGALISHREFSDRSTFHTGPTPSFGVDAAIDLSKHVSIVPSLRLHFAQRIDFLSVIARPGLTLRWRF